VDTALDTAPLDTADCLGRFVSLLHPPLQPDLLQAPRRSRRGCARAGFPWKPAWKPLTWKPGIRW